MLRRSHLSLGIASTFGEKMSLAQGNNTPTRPRIEPRSPDPKSDALTTRPVRSPQINFVGLGPLLAEIFMYESVITHTLTTARLVY